MSDLRVFLKVNQRLVIAVVIASLGLLGMQMYINTGSDECLGVADSKETMVSFETPVIVKRIFVLPGQQVKKGQPLVEVVPAEVNLKLLEVRTELESLESEQKVRDVLLNSISGKGIEDHSPIAQSIAGLRRQAEELKRQQALAIRYAEEDGVVATVAYRPREQVQPFLPIITLTPNKPDLVYGFIHENRAADYKIGDTVQVEPVADRSRKTKGQIVSLGSRITAFPDRFQVVATRPTYFGRELIIRLPEKNNILIGEKVRVKGVSRFKNPELDFLAVADASSSLDNAQIQSQLLKKDLPLEAGGVVALPESNTLLLVSDDIGPEGSPFWKMPLSGSTESKNLAWSGMTDVEDLEAMARGEDGQYYASASLFRDKAGQHQPNRNKLIRFQWDGQKINVNRNLDFRTPLLEALRSQALLEPIAASLEEIEVEAFSILKSDGYVAFKQPQMPDGSSIILRIPQLKEKVEQNSLTNLSVEIYSIFRLESDRCKKTSRITDIVKTENGMMILSNCKKSERTGQIWRLNEGEQMPTPALMFTVHNGQPEGLGLGKEPNTFYVTSDNGNNKGSEVLRVEVPQK